MLHRSLTEFLPRSQMTHGNRAVFTNLSRVESMFSDTTELPVKVR